MPIKEDRTSRKLAISVCICLYLSFRPESSVDFYTKAFFSRLSFYSHVNMFCLSRSRSCAVLIPVTESLSFLLLVCRTDTFTYPCVWVTMYLTRIVCVMQFVMESGSRYPCLSSLSLSWLPSIKLLPSFLTSLFSGLKIDLKSLLLQSSCRFEGSRVTRLTTNDCDEDVNRYMRPHYLSFLSPSVSSFLCLLMSSFGCLFRVFSRVSCVVCCVSCVFFYFILMSLCTLCFLSPHPPPPTFTFLFLKQLSSSVIPFLSFSLFFFTETFCLLLQEVHERRKELSALLLSRVFVAKELLSSASSSWDDTRSKDT